jgi:hypothetical protein
VKRHCRVQAASFALASRFRLTPLLGCLAQRTMHLGGMRTRNSPLWRFSANDAGIGSPWAFRFVEKFYIPPLAACVVWSPLL